MTTKRGFTLIEILIYLALFSMLMSGAVVSMYTLFESASRSNERARLEQEGNYLLGKIDWYLSQSSSVQSPTHQANILTLQMRDSTVISVRATGGQLQKIQNGVVSRLNNSNVSITNILFTHDTSIDGVENVGTVIVLVATSSDGHVISQTFLATTYLHD